MICPVVSTADKARECRTDCAWSVGYQAYGNDGKTIEIRRACALAYHAVEQSSHKCFNVFCRDGEDNG